ncbi:MAG: amino acid permease [Bacteroidetes bacterium]|nr:amino acid permease [Bacteroidota bacterium]
MVGGGIFTILGISVSMIGQLTPIAIIIGGLIAALAAFNYVKLGVYYKDEGATYSFFKRTYSGTHFLAAVIGWFIIFGYISTLALYAYTFSSYAISSSEFANNVWVRKGLAIGIVALFAGINIWSVNGMGKIEDLMVYTKLMLLLIISFILIQNGSDITGYLEQLKIDFENSQLSTILIVASVTFVAYEGFQLVINAVNEMDQPEKNIPRAIYIAIGLAVLIYVVIAFGALLAIPAKDLIQNKEYALAAGAGVILGPLGTWTVIIGALLATSSAISGTVFGSSRQAAVIAADGYFPNWLSIRQNHIPKNAILFMSACAAILILSGGLELILEFGSITFLLVSLLMAVANHKIRKETKSPILLTALSIAGLSLGTLLILYYEIRHKWEEMVFILFLYLILTLGAWFFAHRQKWKGSPKAE